MGENMARIYDGKKTTKLGTEKNPAVVRVKTEKKMAEVVKIFENNGWKYKIELDGSQPEDVADLDILLNWPKPTEAEKKVGRNEPCPCGSGKKYKKCCGS
jgi:SWIM/SEC-C metal-binding protein